MTSDEPLSGKIHASLARTLTGAWARIFASAAVGLLVWADVISVKVPFYFIDKATLAAREAASFVAAQAAYVIPDILDQLEKNSFSASDAAHIGLAIAAFYLGYRFFRLIWRALKKINPIHWEYWPRLGFRRRLLLASLLAAGAAAAWQLGAFPWIGAQILDLVRQASGRLSWQNLSDAGQQLWHGFVALYENRGTVVPAVKGVLAGLATYATLEVARAAAGLVWPAVRLGRAVYGRASSWLPDVGLSQRQKDWLHITASVAAGLGLGFNDLSIPAIPLWTWAVLAPGLFFFARERPVLVSQASKAGLKLARCFRRAAEFAVGQPKWTAGIIAGFMVGLVAASALFSSHPLLGFAIIWAIVKAAYAGAMMALLIASGRGSAALAAHARRMIGQLAAWRNERIRHIRAGRGSGADHGRLASSSVISPPPGTAPASRRR
jgi:hypothetical protein